MALELVVGALLSSSLNVLFERMASHEFRNFFKTQKIDMELLDELKTLLNTVNGVLDDAEDRQITSPAVKNWVDDLRDAAYEADDLLDLIAYEATAAKVEAQQRTTGNQMRNLFCFFSHFKHSSMKDHSLVSFFSNDVPTRMEDVVRRLHLLVRQIVPLGLKETSRKKAWSEREPTTSVVEESGVFGRDGDKEAIFKLLQEHEADGTSIGVIPIVGMGGIGKTTLSQIVYNDSRAQALFDVKAWVCVSENYDAFRIKREILKHVSNSGECDRLATNQIDEELKKSLKNKRYLLVLDDIWNDSYADWDKLKTHLESGARGSKIIITTRNQSVASIMCTIPSSYRLDELDVAHCWLLFVKHAFNGGSVNDERLEAIGKEIVKKCRGLPLAAKMLGGLLRHKREVTEWANILNSNIWDFPNDDVLPALRLSYLHLPSYLKQCFAYCAIFPQDYQMEKEEIIHLWMAEGFLAQPIRGKKMEALGEECIVELVSRSFLQQSTHERDGPPLFGMHDLINDLAKFISGNFLERMEGDDSCKIDARNRHFSYMASKTDSSKIVEAISDAQCLRTFLALWLNGKNRWVEYYGWQEKIAEELLHNQIPRLLRLRVLSLSGFDNLVKLPDSIGDLKQLRYLNLTGTRLERLPKSLCTLYNLQTLILYKCNKLVELPKNIGSLINLRCLDIRGTQRLEEMPPGMGNLKDLRTLRKFVVGKQSGSNINELGKLQHLRTLSILNLQNVANIATDVLKNSKHLENLKLEWSSETEDSEHERRVLEGLQPYTSINELSISGYGGTKFADWVGDSSYTNIVSLELNGCKYSTSLPPLGQLPFLEHLKIKGFDSVQEVGAEFYGSCSRFMKTAFRSLKKLRIQNMRVWQNWVICGENESVKCETFPELKELEIWDCPNLRFISSTHKIFKSLNRLQVGSCNKIKTSNLLAISDFKELELICAGRHVLLEQLPSAMYRLYIDGFSKWRWDEIICNPTMEGIEEMRILFNALDHITIRKSGICECIPLEMLPNLKSILVSDCNELKSLSASEEPLHQPLTSLASLEIISCRSLISFPEGGIPAPNLARLKLRGCSSLKSLPERMHLLLPSLVHLEIYDCPELESFPEEGLPSSLSHLKIANCPILKERCEREQEKHWPKISRIATIEVDGERI